VQRPSARRGRPVRPSAVRIAPGSAAVLRPACRGRQLVLGRRRELRGGAGDCRPAAAQPEFRQRARRPEAFHPVGQGLASRSELGLGRGPASPIPDVQPAASRCRSGPALPLEQAWLRGLAIPPPEARRDVRRVEARRGGRLAVHQACCPEPALRSAQGSASALVSPSERAWLPAQLRRGGPWAQLSEQAGLPRAQASAGPTEPRRAEAEEGVASGEPQAAAWWVRAAAEPRPEAVPEAWAQDVPRAAPEEAVSGRAAAGPRPEAAQVASGRPAAVEAAQVASGRPAAVEAAQVASERPAAAAGAPDGPQAEAKAVAVAALPGAAVRLPAGALRAGGAVQPRAAVPLGARVLQVGRPRAVPSAAASVFRQGPSLAAGPVRPRAAKRFARAMRCLPIASRSEPSSQAARYEGWSWW